MRVYLSGPITNMPDHNRAAFDAAAKRLRDESHFVINPHELTEKFGTAEEVSKSFDALYCIETFGNDFKTFHVPDRAPRLARAVMDADLAAVRSCDAIYLLKGWENSRGAKKELHEAIMCGLEIMQEGAEG